ncbi:MAG: tyrosine--tRNA ligase [bacterium]|nr:tyrosine--tRNA ligase [bacterium]
MRYWTRMNKAKKKSAMPSKETIAELLTRGIEDVIVREHLEHALQSGKRLRIKHGIDPTGPNIHIGRAISLWKLKAFQDLGHTIVLIIGDFTAQIGDPSDKLAKRPFITEAQIKKNLSGYLAQIGKIIDLKKAEIAYNSKWLAKLTLLETAKLAESFSVQQILARRNFRDRLERQEDISLRELLYPLMQGYDSVAIEADVEIGGADQLFNLHAGRAIQQHYGKPQQDILTTQMLEGLDGRKMSTSWGNVVNITDPPADMYGKIMSLHDDIISKYYLLCCPHLSLAEISGLIDTMKQGNLSPRDAKMRLAKEMVSLYYGTAKAEAAEAEFARIFQKKEAPSEMPEYALPKSFGIIDLMEIGGFAESKTEAKRLVEQGAVSFDGKEVKDWRMTISEADVGASAILQVGKRRFARFRKPA